MKFWVAKVGENGEKCKYIKPHGSYREACWHAENFSRKYQCETFVKNGNWMTVFKNGELIIESFD